MTATATAPRRARHTRSGIRRGEALAGWVFTLPVILILGKRLFTVDHVDGKLGTRQQEAEYVPGLVCAEVARVGRRMLRDRADRGEPNQRARLGTIRARVLS